MDYKIIQEEISKVEKAPFARKTDKQLISYEVLSQMYKSKHKGVQPPELVKYNKSVNRHCKLTIEMVNQIRSKYNPYVYGKQKLAKEYGVSHSVVLRIIKGKSWKPFEDSS